MKNILFINILIASSILVGTYLFDSTLTLGTFEGLVFLLYSAYGIGAQLLINLCIAIIYSIKKRTNARAYWSSSFLLFLILALLYILPTIIQ